MKKFSLLHRAAILVAVASVSLAAQDTTRGVRIGLTYDPGSRPGVVVVPGKGPSADSVRAIIERDLGFGDRVNVIVLEREALAEMDRAPAPMWAVLAKLGAAAMVQVTPVDNGQHLAVYDVAKQTTALVRDYPTPPVSQSREWRAVIHGISDDLEESLTGTRGIARTRVMFERSRQIWVVDSDGEHDMAITDARICVSPAWSPNGSQMTYVSLIPAQVVVQDLRSRRSYTLASGSGVFISPVFTPDGTNVVFSHGVDDGTDLYVSPAAGGGSRKLSVGRGSENVSPTLSPDGRRIAFTSNRQGHFEIYTMDSDGTNTDLLSSRSSGDRANRASPDWSPDGRLVALVSQVGGRGGRFQIMTLNLRDRAMKQLTSDGENKDPSWAPDARHLVFVSNRTGVRQLWVLDVETGKARQLTHGVPVRDNPAWSPRLTTN